MQVIGCKPQTKNRNYFFFFGKSSQGSKNLELQQNTCLDKHGLKDIPTNLLGHKVFSTTPLQRTVVTSWSNWGKTIKISILLKFSIFMISFQDMLGNMQMQFQHMNSLHFSFCASLRNHPKTSSTYHVLQLTEWNWESCCQMIGTAQQSLSKSIL